MLDELPKALKAPGEGIRSFSEEAAFNIINNTYHDNSASVHYTFDPIEKIVELYEALLKSKSEKVEILQKLLETK